jgi:O-antigen ligase
MEITPIGWVLLALGAAFLFVAPSFLYPLMVFFLPFSATALANLGSADSSSGVQASMFFGTLWMLRELPKFGQYLTVLGKENLRPPVRRLTLFVGVVVLSLVMPIWINGHLVIESSELADSGSAPLQFSVKHITQTFYLVYGVLLAMLVAVKNVDVDQLRRSLRIFLISAVFVSLWGFFQFVCPMLNLEYPAYIFNTSASESAAGYTQQFRDLGLQRISSVATEPSMFAQCMLVAAVIALFAIISERPLISKTCDRFAVGVIVGALLLSTSATAYVGLGAIVGVYVLSLWALKVLRARYVFTVFAFGGMLLYMFLMSVPVQDLVESLVLGKGESYSALSRLNSILLARNYFLQYPLLGVGWGSVTSHDLVFRLLSNTGIFGLIAFALFLVTGLTGLFRAARAQAELSQRLWPLCFISAVLIVILTNVVSDFTYTFSHIWFVFGLAMSVAALGASQRCDDEFAPNFSQQMGTTT